MAENIVSLFLNKLVSLIEEESGLLGGVREKLVLLRRELEWMKSFLKDAETKRGSSHLVDVWVTQITELTYEAEDVIDAYVLHVEQENTRNFPRKIIDFGRKLKALHELGNQIEQINTSARRIAACRSDYNLDVSDQMQMQSANSRIAEEIEWRRKVLPTLEESDIVGFKKEIAQLISWLEDDKFLHRKVISIIGMGGLGKTTLARVIYNRNLYFQARAWVTVSQKYEAKDLLLSTLEQLSNDLSRFEKMNIEELEEEVCEQLRSKRYLVVIDDIWNVQDWEHITGAFPNNERKSRIILTSRKNEVASQADPLGQNQLKLDFLDNDESWKLFCRKVFSMSGDTDCPSELCQVGKAIVNKCAGLPLAILVIGGILTRKEKSINAWSKVLDSVVWHLSQDSNVCQGILSLSYIDLPYYLKSCFLYLGLFPEDVEIRARRLVLLWVSEGFTQIRGEEKMEDIAEDCLEELVQRSMIQVTHVSYYGGPIEWCRVHDLLRDLAISEARKDRFADSFMANNSNSTFPPNKPRRLALDPNTSGVHVQEYFRSPVTTPKLRSLLVFNSMLNASTFFNGAYQHGIKMLRVLDLEGARNLEFLPKDIGKLIFLRYLSVRNIPSVPSSIGKLVNLQTLDLGVYKGRLPKTIWKLKNIRHLYLGESFVPPNCLDDFGRSLLTLETTATTWMYLSEVLVKIGFLRSLELWSPLPAGNGGNLEFCFPSSLTKLYLNLTGLECDPSIVLGGLPKLKVLVLGYDAYRGTQLVFGKGGFPQLQYIALRYLGDLKEWRVEEGGIPHLKRLLITCCGNLIKLPEQLKNITCLQKIEIVGMPAAFEERVKPNGEDWNIIRHVPFITVTDYW